MRAPSRFRRLVLLGLGLMLPVVTAGAQSGQRLIVRPTATPCLVMRSQPSADARSLDCLAPGTEVTGVGTAPYWRQIRLADGKKGWSAKKFLGAPDSAQVAPTPGDISENAWIEVHFVDVGQGDGIWIHTYDDGIPGNGKYEGKNIIIDGGPTTADAGNPFLKYLQKHAHDGATIDALFLTHPHNDHYPGATSLVNHYDVCDYYDPGYPKEGPGYNGFLAKVRGAQCGRGKTKVHLGQSNFGSLDWGSELTAEVLYSWSGSPAGLGNGNTVENNASIVLKITYGSHSFLFMGDAEGKERKDSPSTPKYAEAILLNGPSAGKLKSTVLKLAHHGSETSSSHPFISAVDPSIIIVNSGRKSFSGTFLPDATTLERYCSHNPQIRIYRTDQDDEAEGRTTKTDKDDDHVVIRTNGKAIQVSALSNGKPFSPTACSP